MRETLSLQQDTLFVQYDAQGEILAGGCMFLPVLRDQISKGALLLAVDQLPKLNGSYIVREGKSLKSTIRFNDPIAIKSIEQAIGVGFHLKGDQCVARFDQTGKLLGGVFFTNYNIASIQIHVAGFVDNWIDRSLLWVALDWPYTRLGVNKMLAHTRESNWKSIAFCTHFGFNVEARVRDVFPDGDLLILSLYKSDCRFLKMRPPQLTIEGNYGPV